MQKGVSMFTVQMLNVKKITGGRTITEL